MIDYGCCQEMGDECDCDCHHAGEGMEITHVVACCFKCPYCHLNISTHVYDEHIKRCVGRSLDIELKYFEQNRQEWFEHHAGKFVLLKGITVHDFYDSADNAYKAGVDRWGNVSFLIKEVLLEDQIFWL